MAPTPVSTIDGEFAFVSRPTTLASATPNKDQPNIFASMIEAMVFMKNFDLVTLFEGRYNEAVQSLRNQARRTRRDDMEAPASPAGADNPVVLGST